MEQFQGPGACLVVERIIREGTDDASQEKGQSCLFVLERYRERSSQACWVPGCSWEKQMKFWLICHWGTISRGDFLSNRPLALLGGGWLQANTETLQQMPGLSRQDILNY